jgi:hypothetical protein
MITIRRTGFRCVASRTGFIKTCGPTPPGAGSDRVIVFNSPFFEDGKFVALEERRKENGKIVWPKLNSTTTEYSISTIEGLIRESFSLTKKIIFVFWSTCGISTYRFL